MMLDTSQSMKKVLGVLEGTDVTLALVVMLLAWRTSFLGVVRHWLMAILTSDGLLLSRMICHMGLFQPQGRTRGSVSVCLLKGVGRASC